MVNLGAFHGISHGASTASDPHPGQSPKLINHVVIVPVGHDIAFTGFFAEPVTHGGQFVKAHCVRRARVHARLQEHRPEGGHVYKPVAALVFPGPASPVSVISDMPKNTAEITRVATATGELGLSSSASGKM